MTATLSLSFQKASSTIEYPCVVTASSGEDGIIYQPPVKQQMQRVMVRYHGLCQKQSLKPIQDLALWCAVPKGLLF